ncbi:hypothetical protein BGZ67_000222 [Mortierella alpina]|nr:hypothetical protein BGZ67_000222 [Mortierella alpina]
MFEQADYVQPFSYNGIVRKLEVFRPAPGAGGEGRDFVLLEDVSDHFNVSHLSGVHFERQDGVSLSFTRDKNLRRHVPERIPACKGTIIYIIPSCHGNNDPTSPTSAVSPPTSSSSSYRAPALTASSTLSVIQHQAAVTAHVEATTATASSDSDAFERHSRLRQSIIINIPETHNPHGPVRLGHIRTVQDSSCVVHTGHGTRGGKASAARFGGKEEFNAEFEEQERKIAEGIRQEAEGAVIDVLERYKEILVWFALILAKAEEILTTSYDFEHGNGPRLFVILPSLDHKWDSTNILTNQFRLFFLCECGTHSPTPGQDTEGTPCLHLADHEGYIVREPIKFIDKFGPYLMVMLEMLKFSNQIAGYVLPGLSAAEQTSAPNAGAPTSLTLDRVNKSILYIETVACLDTLRPWDLTKYLTDVKATDGVDSSGQMPSYLEMGKDKTLLSKLYRIRTTPVRADWVCRKHESSTVKNGVRSELESILSTVGACLDYERGKITVSMTSSQHGEQLCNVLARAPGAEFCDLELTMDSKHSSEDMDKLQKLAALSFVNSVSVAVPPPSPSSPSPSSPTPSSTHSGPLAAVGSPIQEYIGSHSDYASISSRSSSRSDSFSSDQPSPLSVNTKLPDWVYTFYDQQSKQQYEDGRTRHTVESAPYMLPNDLTESDRLDAQHYIVRYCFQGNYNVKLDRTAPLKILDVATGTGVWALEMAQEFPTAEIHGVDISPIYPTLETSDTPVPSNCRFRLCNVLDGLPYPDNYFDFVYQRLLVYAFTPAQRKQVNIELLRVLKPSGYIQLVESDGLIYNPGPTTAMANALSLDTPRKKSVDPTDVQRLKPGLKRAGFTHVNSFCIALPVGDWGGLLGQLSRQNMHGLATIWLRGELGRQTAEECETTLTEMDKECEQLQSFYRVWLVVGQKPSLSKIMQPPPPPPPPL